MEKNQIEILEDMKDSLKKLSDKITEISDKINSFKIIDNYLYNCEKNNNESSEIVKELREEDILLIQYKECFVVTLLISFRIFFDNSHPNSISFLKLLKDIKKNSDIFSKQYYLKQRSSSSNPDLDGKWYDDVFGKGINLKINEDKKYIKEKTKYLDRFIDKRIAHYDKDDVSLDKTIGDVCRLFDEIVKRFNPYYLLITGIGYQHQNVSTPLPLILLQSYFKKHEN